MPEKCYIAAKLGSFSQLKYKRKLYIVPLFCKVALQVKYVE